MSVKCLSCSRFVKNSEIETKKAISKNYHGIFSAICKNCVEHHINFTNFKDAREVKKREIERWDISQREFKAWLSSKDGDEIVGKPRSTFECPIGSFYKEEKNMLSALINEHEMAVVPKSGLPHSIIKTRRWAREFTHNIDKEPGDTITADRCLEILRAETIDINAVQDETV